MRIYSSKTRRGTAALACGLGLTPTATACGSSDDDSPDAKGASVDCAKFEQYGDLKGKTVSVYTSIITPQDKPHIDSVKPFEECTGSTINYEGSGEFEAQLAEPDRGHQLPRHRLPPAARPAAALSSRRSRTSSRPRRRTPSRTSTRLRPGVEGVRLGRRQALRRAAGRQREVLRLVLAEDVLQGAG